MRSTGAARSIVMAVSVLAAVAGSTHLSRAQSCPNDLPHVTGSWRTLSYQMPINPISATLLRDGRILIVAGSENDAYNNHPGADTYRAALWDPTGTDGGSIAIHHLEYDVFCSGVAALPHGRVLIVGGSSDYSFKGEARATFFDPATNEFAQSQNMTDGRWYATATTLGDGRIMAFSGLNQAGTTSTRVEIYDLNSAGAGWGAPITQSFTPPLFPRTFVLPSGKVFYTGHGSGTSNSRGYMFDPVAKTWTNSATVSGNRQYGTAVILPLLPPAYTPKVLVLGGGGNPARKTTEIIDLSAATPAWTAGPEMTTGRIQLGAILLPDGKLLVEGGSVNNEAPDGPGKKAEIYTPSSNSFTSAGTAAYSRLYHSAALLLPDATVASMGSNPGDRGRYLGAMEVYTPPYLFDANDRLITTGRPAITAAPTTPIEYNASFSVSYTSASPISSAVLVRPGSVTHAFDMEQRLIGLCGPSPQPACGGAAGSLSLTSPLNGNVAPPGFYMLFLLDAAGVPSRAAFIELSQHAGPPPTGTIASPASDVTITAGGSVSFATTTVAAKYSWVFPGGTPATSTAQNPGNVVFNAAGEYCVTLTVIGANGDSDPSPPMREIYVLPQTADFEIAVTPPSRTITPGLSASFTVAVAPYTGFNGTVSLTADSEGGIPSGVTIVGFSPSTISGSGSSTLTIGTTTGAVPYALSLTIHGDSGALSHRSSTTLLINLAPPTGLIASPSSGQVQLSWLSSVGANGYEVRRSTYPGGGYQTIGCPTLTTFTDTGLVNGTTYYYVVVATHTGGPAAGGASAHSVEVSGTPPCPTPTYSGSLGAAKPGGGDVSWTWSAGGATAYDLLRGDLQTLRTTGGDFGAALDALPPTEGACLANDTTSLAFADPFGAPAAGQGIFTLLRPATIACPAHGTADDGSPSQIQSRDAEIASASLACP